MKDKFLKHIHSFVKTYITVFLTLYLKETMDINEIGANVDIFSLAIIIPAAKWALLSVLRNVYKLLNEK